MRFYNFHELHKYLKDVCVFLIILRRLLDPYFVFPTSTSNMDEQETRSRSV